MCIKHVDNINNVAWNIRNYRYVGDVSVIVAIVSTDVTLKKNFDCGALRIGDREALMIISGAFDQIQVFVQMLGGYF